MAEIWDIVDSEGRDTGIRVSRDGGNIPDGLYHPCVEIWVRVGDRLLITHRHPDKHEGLKYDVPGGAVISGESITVGAVRELSEEVGILADADSLVPLGVMTNGNVYAVSYLLCLELLPALSLQSTEVVGYRLVTKEQLEAMMDDLTWGTKNRYSIYKDKIFGQK